MISERTTRFDVMAIVVIFFAFLIFILEARRNINTPMFDSGEPRVVQIEKGLRSRDIARKLADEKLIGSNFYFQYYLWRNGLTNRLQAGEYLLSPTMTIAEIANYLANGQVADIQLTFPEGIRLAQIEEKLVNAGFVQKLDLVDYMPELGTYEFLKNVSGKNLEGFLFPDTYRFKKDSTVDEIADRFLDNFKNKISGDLMSGISEQGGDLYEILILASIVQAEAAGEGEMGLIAGVFKNRLDIGMLLQADSTVNYATGKNVRQASADDIKVDSLYNTYRHKGLPPSPIDNPGLSAIRAAAHPVKTDYLYFLHPAGNGAAIFAETAEKHSANKLKYLK